MAIAARYKGYRYPIEVIGHAVWLYHRFALSLRDVEELMLARGVVVTYETINESSADASASPCWLNSILMPAKPIAPEEPRCMRRPQDRRRFRP